MSAINQDFGRDRAMDINSLSTNRTQSAIAAGGTVNATGTPAATAEQLQAFQALLGLTGLPGEGVDGELSLDQMGDDTDLQGFSGLTVGEGSADLKGLGEGIAPELRLLLLNQTALVQPGAFGLPSMTGQGIATDGATEGESRLLGAGSLDLTGNGETASTGTEQAGSSLLLMAGVNLGRRTGGFAGGFLNAGGGLAVNGANNAGLSGTGEAGTGLNAADLNTGSGVSGTGVPLPSNVGTGEAANSSAAGASAGAYPNQGGFATDLKPQSAVAATVAQAALSSGSVAGLAAGSTIPAASSPVSGSSGAGNVLQNDKSASIAASGVTVSPQTGSTGTLAASGETSLNAGPAQTESEGQVDVASDDSDDTSSGLPGSRAGRISVTTREKSAEKSAEAPPEQVALEARGARIVQREDRFEAEADSADKRRLGGINGSPAAASSASAAAAESTGAAKPATAGAETPSPKTVAAGERQTVLAKADAGNNPSNDPSQDRSGDKSTASDSILNAAAAAAGQSELQKTDAPDFAQQLANVHKSSRNVYLPQPVPQQVAVNLQKAAQDGVDRLTIQLKPVDLGKIEVRMEFGADGRMRASITAENAQTLDLMRKDSRNLERALQEAGLKTEAGDLSFNLQDGKNTPQQEQEKPRQGRNVAFSLNGLPRLETTGGQQDFNSRTLGPGRVDVRA
jgi:flagellar hook-length control protein FliK